MVAGGTAGFLLDTNVVSQATKRAPAPGVLAFLGRTPLADLHLSSISMGELELGVERLLDAAQRASLRTWLDGVLLPDYAGRVLAPDAGVMTTWARMVLATGKTPGQLPAMDGLIAATALHHHLTLVTRNVRDFAAFGVKLLDPWAS